MKNTLTTLFGLLLILIMSHQAHAVHISKSGMGQVLIFPYYTVNGDFNTLINLVNTTDQAKALRVRFREAANSREVFALNLYLGPHDTWVTGLVKSGEEDGFFTKLINPDNSCTYPAIGSSQLFTDNNFIGFFDRDFYGDDINRLHEGFIEVIEMGVLTGDSAAATLINEQGINNCDLLTQAWTSGSGNSYWLSNPNQDMLPPSGGIMGNTILINVNTGLAMSEPVTILEDFSDEILHFNVDSDSPSLADSMHISAVDIGENSSAEFEWSATIDAVSSLMMKDSIFNEFVLSDSIGAQTDWIMTLPTRQYYVDPAYTERNTPVAPFAISQNNRHSCESMNYWYWDRDEQVPEPILIGRPPGVPVPKPRMPEPSLCYASNNMNINDEGDEDESPSENVGIFSSNFPTLFYENNSNPDAVSLITFANRYRAETTTTPEVLATYFDTGWINLFFEDRFLQNDKGDRFEGLPIIGFSVQQYINSNLAGGVLANYAGVFEHKSNYSVYQNNNSQDDKKSGVQIANDNIGQVLLFPYYTVNNDMNTLISIVNTTDQRKALKVRFLEGKNSRTCLDFNVYLSSYDVWTAGLVAHEATNLFSPGHEGESTVKLITNDKSCTDPLSLSGYEFLPFGYDPGNNGAVLDGYDDLGLNLERCTEGHIEIIDMGDITDAATRAGIDHGYYSGQPANCSVPVDNFVTIDGIWNDPTNITGIDVSSGGLYGSVSLIDVNRGIDLTYDATAITAFSTKSLLTELGSSKPDLSSGDVLISMIETEDGYLETTWQSSIDAVTALFMQAQTINDFVISPSIGAQTEWVNTFPTKRFYVDPKFSNSALAMPPFSRGLTPVFGACEYHRFNAYNREQKLNNRTTPVPSYENPPANFNVFPEYCWSVNVSKVQDGSSNDTIFNSNLAVNDYMNDPLYTSISAMPFTEGWMDLNHEVGVASPGKLVGTGPDGEIHEFYGKPLLGFSAQKYVNGALGDENNKVLANYGLINQNKIRRKIVIIPNK